MSNTDVNSGSFTGAPPPPRLTGDYQSDSVTLADYLADFYNGAITLTSATVDPNNLPVPGSSSIADAQLVANRAYAFCVLINNALEKAGISGFPVTEPT